MHSALTGVQVLVSLFDNRKRVFIFAFNTKEGKIQNTRQSDL
jgi:hypothetical protein